MSTWHIAQFNAARALAPIDSPVLAEFMAALDRVNALADSAPGFVWRLQADDGNSTSIRASDDPLLLVTLSVWTSVEALFDYVYKSAHTAVMVKRRQWFEAPSEAHLVLWWIPTGHVPTVAEAMARLEHLRRHGPSAHAFTFRERHPLPGETGEPTDMEPERYCSGPA